MYGGDIMEIRLQKWGNSFGIRIPKNVLDSLKLKENDFLKLEQVDDRIVISKSNVKILSLNIENINKHKKISKKPKK